MNSEGKLIVCVRKRPIFSKEEVNGEIDALSCSNPLIRVHECKFKVDGVTKFVDNNQFGFDHTFSELDSTKDVYDFSLKPSIELVIGGGIVTSFAYGQTGSGKTYTMLGIQENAINELFDKVRASPVHPNTGFFLAFFEIYGGECYDLLNKGCKIKILEDKNGAVRFLG